MPDEIKISVIIPTIQKCLNILEQLISILKTDEAVDEIIIINNLPKQTLVFNQEKVRIITPNENLYVNPSWNLGIKEAKNNNIAILNDDIIPCKNICSMVLHSAIYRKNKTGLIGATNVPLKNIPYDGIYQVPDVDKKFCIKFNILNNHLKTGDWGIAIFGKREKFYEIPNDLKIIYGDNYMLLQNKKHGNTNYYITNAPILHLHSPSSSSSEFSEIIKSDLKERAKYFE